MTTALARRFWAKVDRRGPDDYWPWIGGHDKYGVIYVDGRLQKAHQVSLILDGQDIPAGAVVCHRCDNGLCVNPSHLWVGSQSDNVRDMYEKGRAGDRWIRGEEHSNAVLTWDRGRELRRRREEFGATYDMLAEQFGVSRTTAHCVVTGKTWREDHR